MDDQAKASVRLLYKSSGHHVQSRSYIRSIPTTYLIVLLTPSNSMAGSHEIKRVEVESCLDDDYFNCDAVGYWYTHVCGSVDCRLR